jgi:hypothetical protein
MKISMETDTRYCGSMLHLLRGRELGSRNILTPNVETTQCLSYDRSKYEYYTHWRNITASKNKDYIATIETCRGSIEASGILTYTERYPHNCWYHTTNYYHMRQYCLHH